MSTAPGSGDGRVRRRTTVRIDIETPRLRDLGGRGAVRDAPADVCGSTTVSAWSRRSGPAAADGATPRATSSSCARFQRLSQEEGVNLAGVKRIIELENEVDALRARVSELTAELVDTRTVLAATRAQYAAGTQRRTYLPAVVDSRGDRDRPLAGAPPPLTHSPLAGPH